MEYYSARKGNLFVQQHGSQKYYAREIAHKKTSCDSLCVKFFLKKHN